MSNIVAPSTPVFFWGAAPPSESSLERCRAWQRDQPTRGPTTPNAARRSTPPKSAHICTIGSQTLWRARDGHTRDGATPAERAHMGTIESQGPATQGDTCSRAAGLLPGDGLGEIARLSDVAGAGTPVRPPRSHRRPKPGRTRTGPPTRPPRTGAACREHRRRYASVRIGLDLQRPSRNRPWDADWGTPARHRLSLQGFAVGRPRSPLPLGS